MKQLSAVLLTAIIVFNLFGFYAIFVLKQADIRQEMSEKISRLSACERTQTLTLSEADFAKLLFTDGDKEFRKDGKLYDVVSIKKTNGQITVVVEYDANETALGETFGSVLSQQQGKDQNSSPVKTIISHFQQDYIAQQVLVSVLNNLPVNPCCLINRSYPLSSFVADKLAPPPQFLLV